MSEAVSRVESLPHPFGHLKEEPNAAPSKQAAASNSSSLDTDKSTLQHYKTPNHQQRQGEPPAIFPLQQGKRFSLKFLLRLDKYEEYVVMNVSDIMYCLLIICCYWLRVKCAQQLAQTHLLLFGNIQENEKLILNSVKTIALFWG